MTAANKVLLAFVALTALLIGLSIGSPKPQVVEDTATLLSADLFLQDGKSTGKLRNHLKELTLVNFWATWCAPCREEMPMFEVLFNKHQQQGFTVLGVTIDSLDKAQPMLDSMAITYPIFYAEQTGMQLMASAGNPNGFLPYTLLLDPNGKILEQKIGILDHAAVNQWLGKHL